MSCATDGIAGTVNSFRRAPRGEVRTHLSTILDMAAANMKASQRIVYETTNTMASSPQPADGAFVDIQAVKAAAIAAASSVSLSDLFMPISIAYVANLI